MTVLEFDPFCNEWQIKTDMWRTGMSLLIRVLIIELLFEILC